MTEPIFVAIVDRRDGHFYLFDVEADHLLPLGEIIDEVPKTPKAASWAALADDKVERHVDEHVREHFKGIAEKIEKLMAESHAKSSLIGGPREVVNEFIDMIPVPLRRTIINVFHPDHYSSLKDLEVIVRGLVKESQEHHLRQLMTEIEDHRKRDDRGAIGPEEVFECLNLKQAQYVLIDSTSQMSGLVCPTDGSVSVSSVTCPNCLGTMQTKEDLTEAIKVLAASQDATIWYVDALLPDGYHHIAALRRFS